MKSMCRIGGDFIRRSWFLRAAEAAKRCGGGTHMVEAVRRYSADAAPEQLRPEGKPDVPGIICIPASQRYFIPAHL